MVPKSDEDAFSICIYLSHNLHLLLTLLEVVLVDANAICPDATWSPVNSQAKEDIVQVERERDTNQPFTATNEFRVLGIPPSV